MLRFWNNDILNDIELVLKIIWNVLHEGKEIRFALTGYLLCPRGDTHSSKNDDMNSDIGYICSPFKAQYCDESVDTEETGRIDYVFIENPRPEHSFTLDVTRVRRRPFYRPQASGDQEMFLSDHVGLEFTLIVSPR